MVDAEGIGGSRLFGMIKDDCQSEERLKRRVQLMSTFTRYSAVCGNAGDGEGGGTRSRRSRRGARWDEVRTTGPCEA